MSRVIFAALLASILVGCNGVKSSPSYNMIDSNRVIKEAETAIAEVAKVGYEWRDTSAMLADAKAANEAKDYNKAVELAGRAERQAIAAYKQYKLEMSVFKD